MRKGYDLFLSHANKDKISYVNELHKELSKLGISIFYDKDCIEWGDNWKKTILHGTANSEFAIIVISEKFFGREWTERELQELLSRQNDSSQKIVLPLLYEVSSEQVMTKYPELGELQYLEMKKNSKKDIAILFAKQLLNRLKQDSFENKPLPLKIEVKGTVDLFYLTKHNYTLLGLDAILMNMANENLLIRDMEAILQDTSGTLIESTKGFVKVQAIRAKKHSTYTIKLTPRVVPLAIDGNSSKEVSLLFEFSGKGIKNDNFKLKIMTSTDVFEIPLPVHVS